MPDSSMAIGPHHCLFPIVPRVWGLKQRGESMIATAR